MSAGRAGTALTAAPDTAETLDSPPDDEESPKFALEAISDCLRMEVKPFGINVVVIEPGGIRTEWSGIAAEEVEPQPPPNSAIASHDSRGDRTVAMNRPYDDSHARGRAPVAPSECVRLTQTDRRRTKMTWWRPTVSSSPSASTLE